MSSMNIENVAKTAEKVAQNMGDTLVNIIDKLAGKQSDVRLSFEDLNLDLGMMKARLNGAIVLDIVYSKEASTQTVDASVAATSPTA